MVDLSYLTYTEGQMIHTVKGFQHHVYESPIGELSEVVNDLLDQTYNSGVSNFQIYEDPELTSPLLKSFL